MAEKIIDLEKIEIFDNYQILVNEPGNVVFSTKVVESSLNLYKKAHGGYLFTLCDSASGMAVRNLKVQTVTLQSNANFLRGADLGDELTVTAKVSHNGKSTKVVNTIVTNQNQKTIMQASFTMFVIAQNL